MSITPEALTKAQLGQLRAAKAVGFSCSPHGCYIVAESAHYNRHRIAVGQRVHARGGTNLDHCAFCHYSLQTDGRGHGRSWKTLASFLKPGDQIVLDWYRDAETNGYLADTDLHADRLSLVVKRKDTYYEFLLAISVTPDHSSRMILVKS